MQRRFLIPIFSQLVLVSFSDTVRFNTAKERAVARSQQFGRFATVPQGVVQRFFNQRALGRLGGLSRRLIEGHESTFFTRLQNNRLRGRWRPEKGTLSGGILFRQ